VSLILVRVFFCVSCYARHRRLPSFPTRRSSDLNAASISSFQAPVELIFSSRSALVFAKWACRPSSKAPSLLTGTSRRACTPTSRSEEHTSELQSRENLVCRLLLEKKKHTYKRVT